MQRVTTDFLSDLFEESFQRVVAALSAKSHGQRFHLDKVATSGLSLSLPLTRSCAGEQWPP
jgi:hypothetical protein